MDNRGHKTHTKKTRQRAHKEKTNVKKQTKNHQETLGVKTKTAKNGPGPGHGEEVALEDGQRNSHSKDRAQEVGRGPGPG